VESGRAAIAVHRPDLVFLDVEMPPRTGFDLLRELGEAGGVDFHVVFVTAHDHYAMKAIKFSELDYLLKPVSAADLREAVERASAGGRRGPDPRQFEILSEGMENIEGTQASRGSPGAGAAAGRIGLPTKDGILFARVADIIRCDAESNYTTVFLRDGTRSVTARTLGDVEQLLDDSGFVRIHQSHLVNLAHVRRYIKGDGGEVVLSDGAKVSVSRRHKSDLLGRLKKL
jgi:two-component system LytT family response regulator